MAGILGVKCDATFANNIDLALITRYARITRTNQLFSTNDAKYTRWRNWNFKKGANALTSSATWGSSWRRLSLRNLTGTDDVKASGVNPTGRVPGSVEFKPTLQAIDNDAQPARMAATARLRANGCQMPAVDLCGCKTFSGVFRRFSGGFWLTCSCWVLVGPPRGLNRVGILIFQLAGNWVVLRRVTNWWMWETVGWLLKFFWWIWVKSF